MLRHLSFLLFLVISTFSAFPQSTGNWDILPVYGGQADALVHGRNAVYCLVSGNLFSLNTRTDEMRHHSSLNGLNDVQIERIAYNMEKGYLVIVYNSSNVDLLYDNGRIVNIPDIRDANISSSKTVNSIDFHSDGRIYMSTDFGFVALDDKNYRVADSGIYNEAFNYAGEIDGKVVLVKQDVIYLSDKNSVHNSFNSFSQIATFNFMPVEMHSLGERYLLAYTTNKDVFTVEVNVTSGGINSLKVAGQENIQMPFTTGSNGNVYFVSGSTLREFNSADGRWTSTVFPSFFVNKTLAIKDGLSGSVWASDAEGIGEYKVGESDNVTTLRNPARPEALTCSYPAFITATPDGERIYITNVGYDAFRNRTVDFSLKQTTNIIENGEIRDVTCYDYNGGQLTGGTQFLVQDPTDASRYFIANYQKGIFILSTEDGSYIDHIYGTNDENSKLPYHEAWAERCRSVSFDRYGNMWLSLRDYIDAPIYILPADKVRNTADIRKEDWIKLKGDDIAGYKQGDGSVVLHHSRSNFVLVSTNHECRGLLVYNHKGQPTQPSVADKYLFNTVVDQDGIEFKVNFVQCIKEDRNGQIWIGTANSNFIIPDITTAISGGVLHVRRPKVPRNDGTNYADYLLSGQNIYDISFDASNRKWMATGNSGVYLVSADGTEIIDNFTIDNSLLPSNRVLSVCCDPKSSIVYVGTDKGVVKYSSDSSPAAEDYGDVYAYPNPVRPDYTGWITISGLMDNSLVKITDTAGNLVHQGTSEGGTYVWDGCNNSNQRVRSGVYFVFASQNASGSVSGKPVTKIMVVN